MYLQVEITSRCNLKCKMCPLTLGTTASSSSAGLIGDADWEQVKRLSAVAGRVLLVGFGEPVTHPGFVPMLRELDALGVEIQFSTNGIGGELIAPHLAALKCLRHVNISIDSPDPKIYEDIRGGDLSRALLGMRAIANAVPDRVDVGVTTVVMRSNVRSLKAFPAILQDAGIRFYTLNGLHDYAEELRGEHIHTGRAMQTFLPQRRLHTVLDELKAECARHDVELLLNHRTQLDFYKPEQAAAEYFAGRGDAVRTVTRACTVPFDSMYVDSDGQVFPCCQAAGTTPLGSLREQSIEDIWSGSAFNRFRNDLLQASTTPEVCRVCTVAPLGEHPYNALRAEVVSIEALDTVHGFRVRVRNAGSRTWGPQAPMRLAPSRPNDRESIYYHRTWMTSTRVAGPLEAEVPPGAVATIEFQVTPAHGAQTEHFQLVIEGSAWLPDTIIEFAMPEAPPVGILGLEQKVEATGAMRNLDVLTEEGVPWIAGADCDWLILHGASGVGSGRLGVTIVPNGRTEGRCGRIRIGRAEVEITQAACNDRSEGIAALCYWKLLGRIPAAAEVECWYGRENVAAELIEILLVSNASADVRQNARLLTERLFTAFLEQRPRLGRWRGVIRHADDMVEPAEIVRRFLALADVRAMLTPSDNLELPS
jgi:radical SAM protein with 4Fe4S-binding SPASM domain